MFAIENTVWLAPMAGATDYAFRVLAKEQGCDVTVTEMISVKALSYGDKKSFKMLEAYDEKGIKGVQIFGSEVEIFKEVTKAHLNNAPYDFIDINMGCPAPKIVKNGEGSALMNDVDLAMKIVDSVKSVSKKPVSVKLRLGFDDNIVVSFARAMERAGADFVTVHGRTREQMYSGQADWQTINAVAASLNIPVIGNGDIDNAEAALKRLKSAVSAVMIGRGAQGRPWLFRQINALKQGQFLPDAELKERIELIRKHMNLMLKIKSEHVVVHEMRKHFAWYLKGLRAVNPYKKAVNQAKSIREIEEILADMLDNYKQ